MQRQQTEAAIAKYRKALQFDLQHAPAWVGLALCYQEFGDGDMAWASLLKAVECDPDNGTALLLLAQWSVRHQGMTLAIQHLMNHFDRGAFDSQLSLAFVELTVKDNNFLLARMEIERALLWEPQQPELLAFDRALQNHGY
jgi:tetratricopeptide (TPR) repeat protein